MLHKVLVVGGNGFIGSAVCKAALGRGMQVTSISSSGKPYTTPRGHSPSWASKVTWLKADAFDPSSYSKTVSENTAVVHTLGTLIENKGYKNAIRESNPLSLLEALFADRIGSTFGSRNPLEETPYEGSYGAINRDSALRVCETFALTSPEASPQTEYTRPFIYLSAEDIFRPIVPSAYIETKREAEVGIRALLAGRPDLRGVFIRPSLVYHAHFRPLTTPLAALLDLSCTLHQKAPKALPTPSKVLRTLGSIFPGPPGADESSVFHSMSKALTVPPIHVEHVAEAICTSIADTAVDGVVDVDRMRLLIGWHSMGMGSGDARYSELS